jgi:hypothetical protein
VQLTRGPIQFIRPALAPDGRNIALGWQLRGEVVRLDRESGHEVPHLSSLSAEWVSYSRDGQAITYVTYPEADLWRSRSDGSDRLQLTFPPMRAHAPALEQIGTLRHSRWVFGVIGLWVGYTPDGSPLHLRDQSIHHIYALDWNR